MYLCRDLPFKGEIVTPKDYSYEEDRQLWNRAIQKFPKAIFYCICKEDVASVINFAVMNKCRFRIRTGGHNYEGFCIADDALVIDVSRMKDISIDYEKNIVKIEAGVQNRELYEFVGTRGYPFPGGTCPTVGVVGYALGGGWGLSTRLFGVGCDNLVEIEMIDYKGKVITANSKKNSDLFWALRGAGGGNLGVVTALTFRLPPKINMVTLFSIYYPNSTSEEQAEIMNVFQKEFRTLDRRVNIRASFYNDVNEGIAVYLAGLFYGTEEELKDIIEPFLTFYNASETYEYTTFIDAIRKVQALYPDSEKFKSTGTFSYRIYTMEELLKLAQSIENRPVGSIFTAITFYGLGGAVKDKDKTDTAYYYRDSNFIIGLQSVWEDSMYEEENKKWVASKLVYLKSITKGFYINFPYTPLKDYGREYYGGNLCRLLEINRKYDPYNIFRFQQSIN